MNDSLTQFGTLFTRLVVVLCAMSLAASPTLGDEPTTEQGAFFEKEVRPLLSNACFKCHGPKKQQAGLRLDSRAAMLQGGDDGPALVPGKPEESRLVTAIGYQGEIKMPPAAKLKDEQIVLLTKWVKMGAPWPGDAKVLSTRGGAITEAERAFWSFQPINSQAPPDVKDKVWPESDIDRFILARLEAKGIAPVKQADKRTLIRRATFDLIGLPPTPEEVDRFLADARPEAFAEVVDRLLASPAYGERWGRHWLDLVRYADTAGETADYPVREAYRYRNYVIDSFNRDKPYDQFLREQIAGDLLAQAAPRERYAELVTATGFIALSRRFGFDPENYHHLTIQDTIDTLGQSVLGLSLGCARCHDHKFDPVSTSDYYALYGIFSGTNYAFPGSEEKKRPRDLVPLIPPAEAQAAAKVYDGQLALLDEELKQADAVKMAVNAELKSLVDLDGGFEFQTLESPLASPWNSLAGAKVSAAAQSPYANLHQAGTRGVTFPNDAANNAIGQPLAAPWTAANSDLLHFNIDFRNTGGDAGGDGSYRFYLGHGPGNSAAVEMFANASTFFLRSGDAKGAVRPLKLGTWYNVQLVVNLDEKTYSGSVGTPGDVTAFSGKAFATNWDGTIDYFFVDGYGHLGGVKPAHEIDNLGLQKTPIPALADASSVGKAASDEKPVSDEKAADGKKGATPGVPIAKPDDAAFQRLAVLKARVVELDKSRAEIGERRAALSRIGPYEVTYGAFEGQPLNARIQKRGEPTKLGDEVPRRFLEILGGDPLPPGATGSGRLQLAEWLTRPTNPLTARVFVNRIWQNHFGSGLVATESDFGSRGERPTHPELLEYLAARFVAGGWSMKSMHRLIMLSQTYQLSGDFDPNASQADAGNALLWRFCRQRLDAESIRDALLFVGGNLDRSMGGPHPFPAVETWGYTQHNPFNAVYETNRRSVYLMTQRLKRHPYLALFDGADANASTAKRSMTTVPTQALFMMNDPFVHAQSAGLGSQLIVARSAPAERIALAFEITLARPPLPDETQKGLAFIERYTAQLQASQVPSDQHETLSWAAYARTLLSSNEFLFVD